MSYRDELNTKSTENESAIKEQAQDRARTITDDVKEIFNDDTAFGKIMTESLGEILGRITAKTSEMIQEAVNTTLKSDEFSGRLGDQLGWKDVERQQVNTEVKDSPEREN